MSFLTGLLRPPLSALEEFSPLAWEWKTSLLFRLFWSIKHCGDFKLLSAHNKVKVFTKVIGWLLSLTAKALPVIFGPHTGIRCNSLASFLHSAKSPETQAQTSVLKPHITKDSLICTEGEGKKKTP